jgi:hypothetical protein
MFEHLQNVWDTGLLTPYDIHKEQPDFYEKFKKRTGSTRVVALRWTHLGQIHEWPGSSSLLPDRTGLVVPSIHHPEGGYSELALINPDGSLRFTIGIPRIDERSKPEQGRFELPPAHVHLGIDWGTRCDDGYMPYVLDIDWTTGQVLRHVATPLSWM